MLNKARKASAKSVSKPVANKTAAKATRKGKKMQLNKEKAGSGCC